MLLEADVLDAPLALRLKRMVGFRNVAVDDYRKLDLQIVESIVSKGLDDFLDFTRARLRQG